MPKKINKTLSFFIMVLLSMSCASKQKIVTYPLTRTVNQVDDYFGRKVSDPYRWLEDLDSEEVLDWAHSQQDVTQKYLDKILNKGAEKADNLATKKVIEMKNLVGF